MLVSILSELYGLYLAVLGAACVKQWERADILA